MRLKKRARALVKRVHDAVGHMNRDKTDVKPWSELDEEKWADDGSTVASNGKNSHSRRRLLHNTAPGTGRRGTQKTKWPFSSFSIGLWVGGLVAFLTFRQGIFD